MSSKASLYYKYIYREQLDFRYRLYQLSKIKDLDESVDVAKELMFRAAYGCFGYFASSELEKPFLKLAQIIDTNRDAHYTPNSFLHVMTQSYATGGHTRVVERWIDSAPTNQKHSVVILEQQNEAVPHRLYNVVLNHSGKVVLFNDHKLLSKAKKLRDIGMQYEYVVLHIHMWDPTAIVAFGKDDFSRPVIFFNHADHLFWCGSSIVDMLADLRDNDFAYIRGIKNRFTLRVPFESCNRMLNYGISKECSRMRLGLPLNKTIILTVGSSQKYKDFLGCDFCSVVESVLHSNPDVLCVGVGPNKSTGMWSSNSKLFFPVGSVNYDSDYFDYLNACDIYIDSIPIGGGAAKLDALQFKKPVLSYSFFEQPLGEITMGIETLYDINMFAEMLQNLIKDENYRRELSEYEYQTVNIYHGTDNWKRNVECLVSRTPTRHIVNHDFFRGRRKIDDLNVMGCLWLNSFTKRDIDIHDVWHQIKCLSYRG